MWVSSPPRGVWTFRWSRGHGLGVIPHSVVWALHIEELPARPLVIARGSKSGT